MTTEESKFDEDTEEVIEEIKTNYPLAAAILDRVPEMDMEEAGTLTLLLDNVRWLAKIHALHLIKMEDKTVNDQMIESKINEIKLKYPLLGQILDRIHNMNLKETYTGLLVLESLEEILKTRQVQVLREKG